MKLLPLIFLLVAAACTDLSRFDEERVEEALSDSLLSMTESWDIEMEIIEDGLRVVYIRSPYATTYHGDTTETDLSGPVEVVVLDSIGAPKTIVVSKRALYNGRESSFQFRGDVIVVTSDAKVLRTEELDWMQQEREITSEDFVTIMTPQDSIAGYGLTGLDDLSIYTIHEVTGEFDLH